MTVSTPAYLKGHYNATRALGAKVISSDFALEIEGHESMWLLAKQAPWPVLAPVGEVEVPSPLGATHFQPQQIKIAGQGTISLLETTAGNVDDMLLAIITQRGYFNCKIYEGTPQKYLRYKQLYDCFIQLDNPDRDWENRQQPLLFTGNMYFHFFGDIKAGNVTGGYE
jgi:hypothetical protein